MATENSIEAYNLPLGTISHLARRVVFAGTFTADGLEVVVEDGRLRIVSEGSKKKLVGSVEQITFNEGMAIRSNNDIESVRRVLEAFCGRIGHKASLIVNYDGFRLEDSEADAYFEMVRQLQLKYYSSATRFTSSAFMRMKLGAAFSDLSSASHICETHAQAATYLAGQ